MSATEGVAASLDRASDSEPPGEPRKAPEAPESRRERALSAALLTTARSVRRTADGVARARASDEAAWKGTEDRADLPELMGEPLEGLAIRLDREADFHRSLAVRALKPGPGRLLAVLSGTVLLIGGGLMTAAASARAFFGASIGDAPASEAFALALLLGVSATVGLLLEAEQARRARAALSRAELAERRLERLAATLALSEADPKRFAEALSRMEREPTR